MISPSLQCRYSRIFAIKHIERHLTGALSRLGGEALHTHQVHAEGGWRGSGSPPAAPRPATPSPGGPLPAPRPGLLQRAPACEALGPLGVATPRTPGGQAAFAAAKGERGSFPASLGSRPPLISLPGSGGSAKARSCPRLAAGGRLEGGEYGLQAPAPAEVESSFSNSGLEASR